MAFFEKQISTETVYTGRIVNIRNDIAELNDGSRVPREVVEHPGGVAIVPVTEKGEILMVRQYRYPMEEELLEIPAGKLESCEDHAECARRELSEETGCTAGDAPVSWADLPLAGLFPGDPPYLSGDGPGARGDAP